MTIKQISLFLIAISTVTVCAAGQVPQSAAPPSTSRPEPFAKTLKKAVALIRVAYTKDGALMVAEGTCFFVLYEDKRLGENGGFMYLVTNHHVASPGIEDGKAYPVQGMHLRLNLRNSDQGSEEATIPANWYFPADDSVDLALLPLLPDQTKYDYLAIPASIFATHDTVESRNISEGDSVLIEGYFYQFPGLKKFQPILREGILAMMPDENMTTTLKKPGHLYLADLHVFGGNSGSPLLVNLGGIRNGNLATGYDYRLLGIVSGYYHEDSNLNLTIATTAVGTLEQNSGIAMVVPVDELKALLDSPPLQAMRDAEAKQKGLQQTH